LFNHDFTSFASEEECLKRPLSKKLLPFQPQRALAPTRSKSSPVFGSGTSFSINLISLFPRKWGGLELGGMIVLIRDEMVDTLRKMVILPCRSFQEICDEEASDDVQASKQKITNSIN
jgi:hypothetical protein